MRQGETERPRWAPSPLLLASAALHVGAGLATLMRPRVWPWALGGVVANHLLLSAAGLWPRSHLLGPNWTRLPAHSAGRGEVAITIDDGPDPQVTPRVLSQLARYRARASFFCVGERVERYPELAQEIVRCGHTVENHTQRHRHSFSLLGPGALRAEIARAQDRIARVTGSTPCFFRAPAGLRNPFLDPVLFHLHLRLTTWTRRGFDTVTRDADVVYPRLVRSLREGDILLLHDGNAARGSSGVPVILEVLPRLLETLSTRKLQPITLRAALQ
jgi:peptidoglycan-N-acetylglucosamine deacetylase